MKEMRYKRNSSIELLRIISMLMIVFHHFATNSGFAWDSYDITISHFWYNFIVMGGKVGVDIFILISGYFLVTDKGSIFNFVRILKFWGEVFFYSVIIFLVAVLLGIVEFNSISAKVIMPITFSSWWFASAYFVLYLIHPFINKMLNVLEKKQYQYLLILLIVIWSIIPTFFDRHFESNNLLWFITLYVIAGYARIYGFNKKFTTKHYFVLWCIFSVLTYLSSITFTVLATKWNVFSNYIIYFYGSQKLSILLISLSLFMTFETLKMKYNKWVNIIASATFGVYLMKNAI